MPNLVFVPVSTPACRRGKPRWVETDGPQSKLDMMGPEQPEPCWVEETHALKHLEEQNPPATGAAYRMSPLVEERISKSQ